MSAHEYHLGPWRRTRSFKGRAAGAPGAFFFLFSSSFLPLLIIISPYTVTTTNISRQRMRPETSQAFMYFLLSFFFIEIIVLTFPCNSNRCVPSSRRDHQPRWSSQVNCGCGKELCICPCHIHRLAALAG